MEQLAFALSAGIGATLGIQRDSRANWIRPDVLWPLSPFSLWDVLYVVVGRLSVVLCRSVYRHGRSIPFVSADDKTRHGQGPIRKRYPMGARGRSECRLTHAAICHGRTKKTIDPHSIHPSSTPLHVTFMLRCVRFIADTITAASYFKRLMSSGCKKGHRRPGAETYVEMSKWCKQKCD